MDSTALSERSIYLAVLYVWGFFFLLTVGALIDNWRQTRKPVIRFAGETPFVQRYRRLSLLAVVISLLAFMLAFLAKTAACDELDYRRRDHQAHTAIAGVASLASSEFFRSVLPPHQRRLAPFLGFGLTMTAGLVKEMLDPELSAGDVAANAIGAGSGAFLSWTFHL